MEYKSFDEWWNNEGRFIDPDTSDVPWFDKREALCHAAFEAAIEAGFRKVKTPLEIMASLWGKLSKQDKSAFLAMVGK